MAHKADKIEQALCFVDVTIVVEKDLRLLLVGAGCKTSGCFLSSQLQLLPLPSALLFIS
jgi:hypothetical protein